VEFCFKAIAEDSIAENSDFLVEMLAPSLECKCGYEGTINEKKIRESDALKSELLAYVAAIECPNLWRTGPHCRRQGTNNQKHRDRNRRRPNHR